MPGDPKPDNEQSKPVTGIPGGDGKPKNDAANKKTTATLEKMNVSMEFIMQLTSVYDQYLALKNAFVQSDEMKVEQAAQKVEQTLAKVDMKLLTGDVMEQWMELLPNLNNQIKLIASSDVLEEQRKTFSVFNDLFYKAIKTFGLMGKTVYYQFCPMMNNNNGAYWLSETKDIRNPYYGESMLTCGETKETLKY